MNISMIQEIIQAEVAKNIQAAEQEPEPKTKLQWQDGRYNTYFAQAGHFTLHLNWDSGAKGYKGTLKANGEGIGLPSSKVFNGHEAKVQFEKIALAWLKKAVQALD